MVVRKPPKAEINFDMGFMRQKNHWAARHNYSSTFPRSFFTSPRSFFPASRRFTDP